MTPSSAGPKAADVVVVGGGIIGSAVAYFLARAGATVTLLEARRLGLGATNAAAGMLAPLAEAGGRGPFLDLCLAGLRRYSDLTPELESETGIDLEFRRTGILRVAETEEQEEALRRRFVWQRELGLELLWLDAATLREAEPRLSTRVRAGLFSPEEGQVSNQMVALALARAAQARGAVFCERTPVVGFRWRRGRVTAVRTPSGDVAGGSVVLAAGAYTSRVARRLRRHLPVRPMRGQMLALGGMLPPIHTIVWSDRGYLVPRANGLVFAGATVEDVGFRPRTTRRALAGLRRMAADLVPQFRSAQVMFTWAGLRPGSGDGHPLIGALPGFDNVAVASGHFRNGILLGPLTGELVAQALINGRWPEHTLPFAPSRFDEIRP